MRGAARARAHGRSCSRTCTGPTRRRSTCSGCSPARIESVPALVVATYRDDELDRTHPLRVVLGELARERAVDAARRPAPLSPAAPSPSSPRPHGVDAGELYRAPAATRSSSPRCSPPGEETIPATVRDAVLARAARLSPGARDGCSTRSRSSRRRPSCWLLDALARRAAAQLDECLASGHARRRRRRGRASGTSSPGSRSRSRCRRRAGCGLHRRRSRRSSDPPGGEPDLARLAHHAEAAGDADAVLRFAPAAAARAATLGAHREAAAQYARALRFARRPRRRRGRRGCSSGSPTSAT